jgi:hypothetical protein
MKKIQKKIDQVCGQVVNHIAGQVYDKAGGQIYKQICAHVYIQVRDQFWGKTGQLAQDHLQSPR